MHHSDWVEACDGENHPLNPARLSKVPGLDFQTFKIIINVLWFFNVTEL